MKYSMMMALLVACGDADPKPETKTEALKKEVVKTASKAEAKREAPKSADKTEPKAGANVRTARTGEQIYTQVCVTCHQVNGEGMTGVYPPLAGSDWMAKSNETLIKVVLHGFMGKIEVNGVKYNNVMSPWGSALNDEEIANVLTYVRSSWGNTGDAVNPEEVKAVRDANQGHPPWQIAEL